VIAGMSARNECQTPAATAHVRFTSIRRPFAVVQQTLSPEHSPREVIVVLVLVPQPCRTRGLHRTAKLSSPTWAGRNRDRELSLSDHCLPAALGPLGAFAAVRTYPASGAPDPSAERKAARVPAHGSSCRMSRCAVLLHSAGSPRSRVVVVIIILVRDCDSAASYRPIKASLKRHEPCFPKRRQCPLNARPSTAALSRAAIGSGPSPRMDVVQCGEYDLWLCMAVAVSRAR